MHACGQLLRDAASDRLLAANLQHEPLIQQFRSSADFLRHFLRPDVGRSAYFVGIRDRTVRMLDEVEEWATRRVQAEQGGAEAEEASVDELALPVSQLEQLGTIVALMEMAVAQDIRACCTYAAEQIQRVTH